MLVIIPSVDTIIFIVDTKISSLKRGNELHSFLVISSVDILQAPFS